jgi:hypothetical protein
MLDLPWQEASYENYGSILELENGDLLTPSNVSWSSKGRRWQTLYNFSSFIARSTDGGKSFKHGDF